MAVFDPSLYNPNASLARPERPDLERDRQQRAAVWREVEVRLLAPRVGFAWDIQGTGQTVVRGGYGMFNYHDEQGPFAGTIDVPAGVTTTTDASAATPFCCSDMPNVVPAATEIGVDGARSQRRSAAAHSELEPHRAAPAAVEYDGRNGYVGSKSDRLRNDGIANINIVPFGAHAERTRAATRQLTGRSSCGGDINRDRAQPLLELPLVADAGQPADRASSASPAPTPSRRRSASAAAAAGRRAIQPPDLSQLRQFSYGMLGNDRRHLFSLAYSWLLPEVKTRRHQRDSRQLAALGDLAVRQRRAAAAGWRRRQLPASTARTRNGSTINQRRHHRVARHPGRCRC